MVFAELDGTTNGIVWTVLAILGAGIVFLMVKVAQGLITSGNFAIEARRIGLIGQDEVKLDIHFFNTTRQTRILTNIGLFCETEEGFVQVGFLNTRPIVRSANADQNYLTKENDAYSFSIPKNQNFSTIVDFSFKGKPLPSHGDFYLVGINEKGKRVRSYLRLNTLMGQNLSFSRYSK